MTPSETATNTTSGSTTATENRGARQYSVSGLDDTATYDIALFPAEYVTNTDGVVTFRDTEGTTDTGDDNDIADWAETAGDIEVVNGTGSEGAGAGNGHVVDVSPVNGSINFTIDSETVDEVIPVIIAADTGSSDGNPDLDLDADNAPTEDFGIGGQKNWTAPEAASGTTGNVGVESVNLDSDTFTADRVDAVGDGTIDGDDRSFVYDANDTFQSNGVAITMAEFEGLLTAFSTTPSHNGDTVTVAYTQNADLASTFNVDTDVVPTVTDLETTTLSDLDGDGTADDATLTWDASTQADAVYNVYKDDGAVDDNYDEGVDTLVEQVSGTSYTVNDATGSYWVGAEGGTSGNVSTDDPSVTPQAAAANVAPLAIDSVVTENASFGQTFDTGDVFKVVYNEAMQAPASGDTIRAADDDDTSTTYGDANDTIADFVNGTNATFTLNAAAETVNGVSRPADTVLTVTLTAAPSTVQAGDTAGLQIPAMVQDQSGIADDDGKLWDVTAGSQDKLIDQDTADSVADSTDTTGPAITGLAVTTGTGAWDAAGEVLTVTFNEMIREGTVGTSGTFTVAELNEVLDAATAAAGGSYTYSISGNELEITMVTVATTPPAGDADGSANDNITDMSDNNQIVQTSPATLPS